MRPERTFATSSKLYPDNLVDEPAEIQHALFALSHASACTQARRLGGVELQDARRRLQSPLSTGAVAQAVPGLRWRSTRDSQYVVEVDLCVRSQVTEAGAVNVVAKPGRSECQVGVKMMLALKRITTLPELAARLCYERMQATLRVPPVATNIAARVDETNACCMQLHANCRALRCRATCLQGCSSPPAQYVPHPKLVLPGRPCPQRSDSTPVAISRLRELRTSSC